MIGSSIIVYPVLFVKDGLIGSLLIMLTIGVVQYFTCRLLVIHNRPDEPNFNLQIKRILGPKWAQFNGIVNVLLIYFVCIAYFLLICQNLFQILAALIQIVSSSYVPPKISQIHFETFSIQWATFIAIILVAPLVLRRDIEVLMKFFKYTIYCVLAYGIFIFISLLRQLTEGNIAFGDFVLFDPNFSNVAGTFALSFLIHPIAGPILKKNVKQSNNERDLFLGYGLTAAIYLFVGFFGGLTCATSVIDINKHPNDYSTVFDCVNSRETGTDVTFYIIGKLVQFLVLIQNLSVMPILSFLTRK
jgi:sodium-coupled neutral amino acid transporter 9